LNPHQSGEARLPRFWREAIWLQKLSSQYTLEQDSKGGVGNLNASLQ
jgi:hypothetical protein